MVLLGPAAIVTILLQGIFFGGILSLIAIGLSLIYGVSGVLNLAHGDFLVLGGIATALLYSAAGLNPFLSIIVVMPIFAAVGVLSGLLLKKTLSAHTLELSFAGSSLVTLGLSNLIEGLGTPLAASFGYPFFAVRGFSVGSISFLGVTLSDAFVIAFIAVILISILSTLWVYRTSYGRLIRATIQDREAATMLGGDVQKVTLVTFGIGTALASLAGVITILITNLDPSVGLVFTVDAFAVVVIGGLGSFYGSLIGGFTIGFVTSASEVFLEELGQNGSEWGAAIPLLILILFLIARPRGLLRR